MSVSPRASSRAPRSSPTPAIVLALALLGALLVGCWWAVRQLDEVPGTVFVTPDDSRRQTAAAPLPNTTHGTTDAEGPGWETLNTPQKLALYPLAERWALMNGVQKRRWLALAQTFPTLPQTEQDRLHERMTAWASLSVQQRNQARINFAATQRLKLDDKRSQWNAYQALSQEEKQRLASKAKAKPHGAATSIQPTSPKKLARVPAAAQAPGNLANPPKVSPPSAGTTGRIAAPGGPQDKAPAAPPTPPASAAPPAATPPERPASDAASAPAAPASAAGDNIYIN